VTFKLRAFHLGQTNFASYTRSRLAVSYYLAYLFDLSLQRAIEPMTIYLGVLICANTCRPIKTLYDVLLWHSKIRRDRFIDWL